MATNEVSRTLNQHCHCVTLDWDTLDANIDKLSGIDGFALQLRASHPHLFCASSTFVSAEHVAQMQALISTLRQLAVAPEYQQAVLRRANMAALKQVAQEGVFFGYDFHIGVDGPQLIEINTNAGGALINAALLGAQRVCCDEVSAQFPGQLSDAVESRIIDMFRQEWQLARGDQPLRHIAIVDDTPEQQGLYPEFIMFRGLFARHGIDAVIVAPEQLRYEEGALRHNGD
jgi:hypothetical protein